MAITKPSKSILKKCPNCEKLAVLKFRPFCSSRCSQLDLSKWLNENYRVPVVEIDDFDEEEFLDEEN
jgi:endogenous inhibitor of DNA gyrase (YacG/DUF329 family)